MTDRERLYGDRAELYDRIYRTRDYRESADRIRSLLDVPPGARLLEAACGTGLYLVELRRSFEVAGFDRSPEMLAIARARLPDVPLFRADMADFAVEEPYDVVGCLFSSIGYLLTDEALSAALRCFRRALRPGGTLVIEPWVDPEVWADGAAHLQSFDDEDLKGCRAVVSRREGDRAVLDFHWLVVRPGDGVEHFTERHELRFLSRDETAAALEGAGFEPRFHEGGRGLWTARRR